MKRKILNHIIYIIIPIFSVILCRMLKIAQGEKNEEIIIGIIIGIIINIIYLITKQVIQYTKDRNISKKKIVIVLEFIFVIILAVICYRNFKLSDFDKARRQMVDFLDNNIEELQNVSNELLETKSSKKYKNKIYVQYKSSGEKEYIQFDIDSQGMLGGQYWGIIYSPNDDFLDDNTSYTYNEKEETGDGNNIFIKEKVQDNWYFYYDDYDGKVAN